jgi:hypothetical protein
MAQSKSAGEIGDDGLQPRAETALGNLCASFSRPLHSARRATQSVPPILGDLNLGWRNLRHLMAGGRRIIAGQAASARPAPLRSQVNHTIHFCAGLERAPGFQMPGLCALLLAAWFMM